MKNEVRTLRKVKIHRPDRPEIRTVIDRENKLIATNTAAASDAKIILLLPPGWMLVR